MGFRFGKSIRLGKHFRLNVSKSGLGMSAGVKGFRVGVSPRGTRVTSSIPGTGISFQKKIGTGKKAKASSRSSQPLLSQPSIPQMPSPRLFAPKHEKELLQGYKEFILGRIDDALRYFLAAAPQEACAALFAAAILGTRNGFENQAIAWLERIIQSDEVFPTALMQKYGLSWNLKIKITQMVAAPIPMNALGASLLLAELYQEREQIEEAIGLLEELEEISGEPVLTLSLCELYASRSIWDGIIERAKNTKAEEDITLETVVYYGRALYEKGLPELAIPVFSEALRKKKDRSPILLHEALYWRACSYQKQGKEKQADKDFQKIFSEDPDFRDVAGRVGLSSIGPSPQKYGTLPPTVSSASQVLVSNESVPTAIFCTRCGTRIIGSANFCDNCGAPIQLQ